MVIGFGYCEVKLEDKFHKNSINYKLRLLLLNGRYIQQSTFQSLEKEEEKK